MISLEEQIIEEEMNEWMEEYELNLPPTDEEMEEMFKEMGDD